MSRACHRSPRSTCLRRRRRARAALDLDQEEAHVTEDEQIHLVYTSIAGDELEITPGAVRVVRLEIAGARSSRHPVPRNTSIPRPWSSCALCSSHSQMNEG